MKKYKFLLLQTFFSLTNEQAAEYRAGLFKQIHEIVFYGKGGYDWDTIYNFPIWLRKFTWKQINDYHKEQNSQNSGTSTNDINRAKDILQRAQSNDPRTSKPLPSQPRPKINVPDFVTSKGGASRK